MFTCCITRKRKKLLLPWLQYARNNTIFVVQPVSHSGFKTGLPTNRGWSKLSKIKNNFYSCILSVLTFFLTIMSLITSFQSCSVTEAQQNSRWRENKQKIFRWRLLIKWATIIFSLWRKWFSIPIFFYCHFYPCFLVCLLQQQLCYFKPLLLLIVRLRPDTSTHARLFNTQGALWFC